MTLYGIFAITVLGLFDCDGEGKDVRSEFETRDARGVGSDLGLGKSGIWRRSGAEWRKRTRLRIARKGRYLWALRFAH